MSSSTYWNLSSNEFITSMLRPVCLPINAPITVDGQKRKRFNESTIKLWLIDCGLTLRWRTFLCPNASPMFRNVHDDQRMQWNGDRWNGGRTGHHIADERIVRCWRLHRIWWSCCGACGCLTGRGLFDIVVVGIHFHILVRRSDWHFAFNVRFDLRKAINWIESQMAPWDDYNCVAEIEKCRISNWFPWNASSLWRIFTSFGFWLFYFHFICAMPTSVKQCVDCQSVTLGGVHTRIDKIFGCTQSG